jgi:hypothetical protein
MFYSHLRLFFLFMYLLYKITTIITIQKLIPSIGRNIIKKIINIINAMNDISFGNSISFTSK